MLAANVCAAKFLEELGVPALYRVHEPPKERKLELLKDFLSELGLSLRSYEDIKPADYQSIIQAIAHRPDASLIQTVLLRSMNQAVYSPENKGHFGLAYHAYTHFTSPIRRYPDLLTHRAIRSLIRSDQPSKRVRRHPDAHTLAPAQSYPYSVSDIVTMGEQCSLTERRADEATRDVVGWLKCEYLQSRVGEVFPGIVGAVVGFGLFVELSDLFVEGLVHISSLPQDYYHHQPAQHRLVGERTGRTFRLGDRLSVRVVRVSLDERKVDFELVEHLGKSMPNAKLNRDKNAPVRNKHVPNEQAVKANQQVQAERLAKLGGKKKKKKLSKAERLANRKLREREERLVQGQAEQMTGSHSVMAKPAEGVLGKQQKAAHLAPSSKNVKTAEPLTTVASGIRKRPAAVAASPVEPIKPSKSAKPTEVNTASNAKIKAKPQAQTKPQAQVKPQAQIKPQAKAQAKAGAAVLQSAASSSKTPAGKVRQNPKSGGKDEAIVTKKAPQKTAAQKNKPLSGTVAPVAKNVVKNVAKKSAKSTAKNSVKNVATLKSAANGAADKAPASEKLKASAAKTAQKKTSVLQKTSATQSSSKTKVAAEIKSTANKKMPQKPAGQKAVTNKNAAVKSDVSKKAANAKTAAKAKASVNAHSSVKSKVAAQSKTAPAVKATAGARTKSPVKTPAAKVGKGAKKSPKDTKMPAAKNVPAANKPTQITKAAANKKAAPDQKAQPSQKAQSGQKVQVSKNKPTGKKELTAKKVSTVAPAATKPSAGKLASKAGAKKANNSGVKPKVEPAKPAAKNKPKKSAVTAAPLKKRC